MNKLVISNLVHRPLRSVISVVAIAVEVTLILVIVGLSLGMLNDNAHRFEGTGADVMVRPPGSSFLIAGGGAPVSAKIADVLRKLEHIKVASPVITQLATSGNVEVIYGVDLPSFEALSGGFRYLEGGPATGPDDVLIDDFYAASKHLHVGDQVDILNHTFRVAGIVENGKGARKFLPLSTMQELIGAQGKASMFLVKLDDPSNANAVITQIKQVPGMEKYNVMSMREWLSLMTPDHIPGLSAFLNVVVGVAVIIGFIVIFQSMYTAVMERTREIGILKSMGASKAYIVNVILRETLVLAVTGVALGIVVSYFSRMGILHKFPTLRVEMTLPWVLRATVIAIVGAAMGAVYPAWKASRKDPIDALAYE